LDAFKRNGQIQLAILDWMMPGLEGVEVCRLIKDERDRPFTYVIMLTALNQKEDLVRAFEAGADDYVSKPWDALELRSRIKAGTRIIELEASLNSKINELQAALDQVQELEHILPICAWCHKIRDDSDYWGSVEEYFESHSKTRFSHSICPACLESKYGPDDEDTDDSEAPAEEPSTGALHPIPRDH
jgi:CheY-like chemotaxis protein